MSSFARNVSAAIAPATKTSVLCLAVILGAASLSTADDCELGQLMLTDDTSIAAWKPGSTITVNISPAFDPVTEVPHIEAAVMAWNDFLGYHITFNFTHSSTDITGPNTLQINEKKPQTGHFRGELDQARVTAGGYLLHGVMNIDPAISHPGALASAVAHEMGHSHGLDHCHPVASNGQDCPSGLSVMNAATSINDTSIPTAPTAADECAAIIVYERKRQSTRPGAPGGGKPTACNDCVGELCSALVRCSCPDGDCNVRHGRLVGDWQCVFGGISCPRVPACCKNLQIGAGSEPPCGDWGRASSCEWGSICCYDEDLYSALDFARCSDEGWFEDEELAECENAANGPCEATVIAAVGTQTEISEYRQCWAAPSNPGEPNSCGEMGGTYCSQLEDCPSGYFALGWSRDCTTCCVLVDAGANPTPTPSNPLSCGQMGGTHCSQAGYCPAGMLALGDSYDCSPCCVDPPPPPATVTPALPSCGAMGGDYCSQTGSCPSGFNPLGQSFDCNPCCKQQPSTPTPTPTPRGKSCGQKGGDYCSQNGSCPSGFNSLGATYDCHPCCKQAPPPPSCGAMGGDYCSQTGSCPSGYNVLGQSSDCSPCCKSAG